MTTIKQILISRDNMTASEADNLIADAAEAVAKYLSYGDIESAYSVCQEYFGLEPDYIEELI